MRALRRRAAALAAAGTLAACLLPAGAARATEPLPVPAPATHTARTADDLARGENAHLETALDSCETAANVIERTMNALRIPPSHIHNG